MNLLVVGAGAMGRWFATSVAGPGEEVAFADVDPDAAAAAAADCDARVHEDDADAYDLVVVAVPIPVASEAVAEYAPLADRAICDVTGSMRDPVAAMREHAPDRERLSLHPLFAPERAPGNVAAVVDAEGPVTDAVRDRLAAEGNEVFETTVAEHDEAMETVQARAHTAVLAFALAAEEVPDAFHTPVSSALEELVERITEGEPRVYADVQDAFDGAEDVAEAARTIADADAEAFVECFEGLR